MQASGSITTRRCKFPEIGQKPNFLDAQKFVCVFRKKCLTFGVDLIIISMSLRDAAPQERLVWNGRLAQLGEHLPYKQGVTGSSPVLSTIYLARWCSRLARQPVTLEVDSSSLFRVAIMYDEASLSRLNMPL